MGEIGHGCFLLLNCGVSFSHSNKEQNCDVKDFKYDVGDVIRVETRDEVLLFVNETKKKERTLKLSLTEDEWKQACFCALLPCNNDSVSIMWEMEQVEGKCLKSSAKEHNWTYDLHFCFYLLETKFNIRLKKQTVHQKTAFACQGQLRIMNQPVHK